MRRILSEDGFVAMPGTTNTLAANVDDLFLIPGEIK